MTAGVPATPITQRTRVRKLVGWRERVRVE